MAAIEDIVDTVLCSIDTRMGVRFGGWEGQKKSVLLWRARDDVAGASSGDLSLRLLMTQRRFPLRDAKPSADNERRRDRRDERSKPGCWLVFGFLWFCRGWWVCDILSGQFCCCFFLACVLCWVSGSLQVGGDLDFQGGVGGQETRRRPLFGSRNTVLGMKANGCADCPIDHSRFSTGF